MPATLTIPSADPYSGPIISMNSRLYTAPREGNRVVPLSINWGSDSATKQAVSFNLQNLAQTEFSQIVAIYVNNLMSNVDAVFKWAASQFQLTVPAQTEGLYPVEAPLGMNFIVQSANGTGTTEDLVFFDVYNYLPPPVSVARGFTQNVALNTTLAIGAGTTIIIPHADIAGIVTGIQVQAYNVVGGAAASTITGQFQGGVGSTNPIDAFAFTVPAAAAPVGVIQVEDRDGIALPFRTGVDLVLGVSTALASGNLNVVLNYR